MRARVREFETHLWYKFNVLRIHTLTNSININIFIKIFVPVPGTRYIVPGIGTYIPGILRSIFRGTLAVAPDADHPTPNPNPNAMGDLCLDAVACEGSRLHFFRYKRRWGVYVYVWGLNFSALHGVTMYLVVLVSLSKFCDQEFVSLGWRISTDTGCGHGVRHVDG